jgi:hypothetical protein
MGAHHDAALVCDALDAAVATRGRSPMPDTIFPTDRAAQPSCCRPSERHDLASRAGQLGFGRAAGRVAQFGTPSPLAGS